MPTFSPSDVVGKVVIADRPTPIKKSPFDNSPVTKTIPKGQQVGTVYSFLMPGNGRTNLYWQFYDTWGQPYYTADQSGIWNATGLQAQGVKSLEDQKNAIENAGLTLEDKIKNYVIWIGGGIAAFILLRDQLRK
jgi:hypothetical protein